MKVAHIYASNCKSNSGDFLIGIAYKKYFKEVILKTNEEIKYTDFDCRENLGVEFWKNWGGFFENPELPIFCQK